MSPTDPAQKRKFHKAKYSGILRIGGFGVQCHVLEDGRRVIAQNAFMDLVGIEGRGLDRGLKMANLLSDDQLKHLGAAKVAAAIRQPILYISDSGRYSRGFEARLAVQYCQALAKAFAQKIIVGPNAERSHHAITSFLGGLAEVGIIALVDEATGFQEVRPRFMLQQLLEAYLRKDFAKWAKRFPDEFYQGIYTLKGWKWDDEKTGRPPVIGRYTNDLVYARLAPAILDELRQRNPIENGRRKQKHHQWMTEDIGHPALDRHLHALLALMRLSTDWHHFKRQVDRAYPKIGETYLLQIEENSV